jgi:hypothetical protein
MSVCLKTPNDLSGQAGLIVDNYFIDNQVREFEYVDLTVPDANIIQVAGHGDHAHANPYYTSQLDNIRVDVNQLNPSATHDDGGFYYGFSKFRDMASVYLQNGNTISQDAFVALAEGRDSKRKFLDVDDKKQYDEGDLVIHYNYLDAWEKDGGLQAFTEGRGLSGLDFQEISYEQAEQLATSAIDFSYIINEIGMTYGGLGSFSETGNSQQGRSINANNESTRLMSQFSVQGYLGPHDLHIKEYTDDAHGVAGENGITWNSYFTITDLDVYLDIKGVQIKDLQVHNNRGDLSGLNLATQDSSKGNSSFGFAHAQREIYAVSEAVLDVFNRASSDDEDEKDAKKKKRDGIAFNTRFKGDMDIHHLSFGDTGTSVGKYFFTDMYFNSRLTILHR